MRDMEKMLVTQALDERDLLAKKIRDAISKSDFVGTKKPNGNKMSNSQVQVEVFEQDAKSSMQRINDLIDRYERIDSAILLANATTEIEVAGKKMTRASAINLRKTIMNTRSMSDTDFRGMLINKLKVSLDSAKMSIARTSSVADKQREVMISNISSNEKKELTTDAMAGIDTYCNNLIDVLVDPIEAEKKLTSLNLEREELIANLESAIKISNATTFVEF